MMKRLLACLLTVACLLTAFALAEGESLNMRVIKCSERVNIREYPTTNAAVVNKAPLGAVLVGCQQCPKAPDWYAVIYEGIAGYIRGDFLEVVDSTAVPAEVPAEAVPVEEVPVEEPAPDAASADVPEYDPASEVVEEEPIVEETVEAAPIEEAPVEEAPVEETVEAAPIEEAPVEESAPVAAAIELPAVENAPIVGIMDASECESDEVILDADAANVHIVARRIIQGDREYLAVAALDGAGNQLWMKETATSGVTELKLTDAFLGGIAARPLVLMYNAEQGLYAIDGISGAARWLISKDALSLGGSICHAVVPGNGIAFIGGYYGPDPVAIDANGNVLWQASSGAEATWLASIELTSDGLLCAYGNVDGQGNPGSIVYDYSGNVKADVVG